LIFLVKLLELTHGFKWYVTSHFHWEDLRNVLSARTSWSCGLLYVSGSCISVKVSLLIKLRLSIIKLRFSIIKLRFTAESGLLFELFVNFSLNICYTARRFYIRRFLLISWSLIRIHFLGSLMELSLIIWRFLLLWTLLECRKFMLWGLFRFFILIWSGNISWRALSCIHFGHHHRFERILLL
jgi:hypothetical protein